MSKLRAGDTPSRKYKNASMRVALEMGRALDRAGANRAMPRSLLIDLELNLRDHGLLNEERPQGCSKGCTGRLCRDALHCDGSRQ